MSAPRPRRCPGSTNPMPYGRWVRSAPAEVSRRLGRYPPATFSPLRARGGVPLLGDLVRAELPSAPRPRRCPARVRAGVGLELVRSAPAEVSRPLHQRRAARDGPLRARGGVPNTVVGLRLGAESAPRPRRCPEISLIETCLGPVRSAPAEVSRATRDATRGATCPLRARGGVPNTVVGLRLGAESAPRPRRCPEISLIETCLGPVRSAPAEVSRATRDATRGATCPLRARGGVP